MQNPLGAFTPNPSVAFDLPPGAPPTGFTLTVTSYDVYGFSTSASIEVEVSP